MEPGADEPGASEQALAEPTRAPLPRVSALPAATDDAQPRLPAPAPGTTVGRLPAIGVVPTPMPTESSDLFPDPTGELGPDFDMSLPAYLRYAAYTELLPDQRALGVALFDGPGGIEALTDFPVSVTLILDPFQSDAQPRAAAYRLAGHEVALLATGIPPLATPTDMAQIWEVWRAQFPEIVAVVDLAQGGVAQNRETARFLADLLSEDGQGAISQRPGVDGFLAAARAADVASASVYRRLDDGAQSAPTMRRLLDRAAFEAQRQPGILVLGQADNPDTIEVLRSFVQSPSREGVVLTPASAILGQR